MLPAEFSPFGEPIGRPVPDWTPPPHPGRPTLIGAYARLDPLAPADADALWDADRADPEGRGYTYMPYGPWPELTAYRDWAAGVSDRDDPLFLAIRPEGGTPAGVASWLRIAPVSGTIEIGHIHFSPALARSRAATEALVLMIAWAFRAGYRRLEWKCDALNAASRRAAVRLGLSFEGVFRNATVVKGRNRDTAWYAATVEEWPALEAAYAAWLAPGNFDARGRQRQALSRLTAEALAPGGVGRVAPLTPRPEVEHFLGQRRARSARTLGPPAPTPEEVSAILRLALRVPDHGKLEPWRIVIATGSAQERLAAAALRHGPAAGLDAGGVEKTAAAFRQAPMIAAVLVSPKPSDKIPAWEQAASAAALCHNLTLAAAARGWGANWLTGPLARDPEFLADALGAASGEWVAGFVHLGRETVVPEDRPRPDPDRLTTWL